MIKQIAWNTFKNTGDINAFMEFRQVKNMEDNMEVDEYENSKGEWNNNCRK